MAQETIKLTVTRYRPGQDNEPVYCQLGVTCGEQQQLREVGAI